MPEHLRALVVILALAALVFFCAQTPATAIAMRPSDFDRRRNLWFAITLVAFLAHNFWVFIFGAALVLIYGLTREQNRLAMYFFLLFAIPPISAEISGLRVIRYFFAVDYPRLLALTILLPTFLTLRSRAGVERFGQLGPDKFVFCYLALNAGLMFTASTVTNTLRHGVFYAFIDVFLPYYVASRSVRDLHALREVVVAFVVSVLVLSAFAGFESTRHWLLYATLEDALGAYWDFGTYLDRGEGGLLRAQATTGHGIVLGFVTAVGAGLLLGLRKSISTASWNAAMGLLAAGLVCSISRGPWTGAVVMLVAFLLLGPSRVTSLLTVAIVGALLAPVMLFSDLGQRALDYLPFVGTVEAENISYRQRLLQVGINVVMERPFFGAYDYIYSPAIQELRQGQGIIDIVNSYLGVALSSGLVGLSLYCGFFVTVVAGVYRAVSLRSAEGSEERTLGRGLLSVLLGILVMIFTTSSVSVIPVVYWALAGLGVSYARMLAAKPERQPAAAGHLAFGSR